MFYNKSKDTIKNIFISISSLVLLFSCTDNTLLESEIELEPETISYPNVDERLWPFFEKFEKEGLERGFVIDLKAENISGEIIEINEERVAGQCSFNPRRPNHLSIDLDFWNNSNDRFKEFVVFHELGHCQLLRAHREAQNSNGTCRSIMRSGNGECIDNYNRFTRTNYINELFDAQFFRDIFDTPSS